MTVQQQQEAAWDIAIVGYISEHYQEKSLSVTSVAEELGLSPVNLSRLFKKTRGCLVSDYINEVRIGHAKEIMASESNFAAVADACPSEVDINDLEAMVARAVGGGNTAEALLAEVTTQMSMVSGAVREKTKMLGLYRRVEDILAHWDIMVRIRDEREVETLFRLRDVLFSARSCLFAMIDYLSSKRGSRGGALYTDPQGAKPMDGMAEKLQDVVE